MDIIEDKRAAKTFSHESAQVELPMLMILDLHWNGYGMNLDTITELWEEIDSFRCLKLETVPAGYKMTQIIEALDRGTKFMTTTAPSWRSSTGPCRRFLGWTFEAWRRLRDCSS